MNDLIAGFAQWILGLVEYFGYIGVFVLVTLGNLHLPIPTQLTLPLAGFLIEQGQFEFIPVMIWSTAAAVIVSWIFYAVGRWVGEESLHKFVGKFERFKLLFVSDLEKAGASFEKHGGKAVLIGHLIPGIGAFISIPAGLRHMPIFGRFMFYTIVGSIIWNGVHVGLGWVLGTQWELVKKYGAIFEYAVLAIIVGCIVWFVWGRWKKARENESAPRS